MDEMKSEKTGQKIKKSEETGARKHGWWRHQPEKLLVAEAPNPPRNRPKPALTVRQPDELG